LRDLLSAGVFLGAPAILIYLLIRFSLFREKKFRFGRDILRVAFIGYVTMLIHVTWISGGGYYNHLNYNLLPFRTIIEYSKSDFHTVAINNILGNMILTLPLGFFAAFGLRLIPKINIYIYSILIPLIIEFGQLVLFIAKYGSRSVDIDDIILNSVGILIGYSFSKIIFVNGTKGKSLKAS